GLPPFRVGEEAERARLAFSLAVPGVRLPPHVPCEHLDYLRAQLDDLSPQRARVLCPVVLRCLEEHFSERWTWNELLTSRLSGDLIERAIRLRVASTAERFCDRPPALALYLDCVESLRRNPVANLDADASWLAGFFLLGKNWASGAVLVLLGRTRN